MPASRRNGRTFRARRFVMGTYGRFTLSLGSKAALPEFRVKVVSRAGDEKWVRVVLFDYPRRPPPGRMLSARAD